MCHEPRVKSEVSSRGSVYLIRFDRANLRDLRSRSINIKLQRPNRSILQLKM